MKASLLGIHKSNRTHSSKGFLICIALFVVNNGAEASGWTNVALNKPTDQGPRTISNFQSEGNPLYYRSSNAVDGNLSTEDTFCAAIYDDEPNWWLVDLQAPYQIYSAYVLNSNRIAHNLENFTVDIFDQDPRLMSGFPNVVGRICFYHRSDVSASHMAGRVCNAAPLSGRFLRLVKWGFGNLIVCEVRYRESDIVGP